MARRESPAAGLKNRITQATSSLPHPLGGNTSTWCTWGGCTISPRLYHEPLSNGSELVGWTDATGDGHVSVAAAKAMWLSKRAADGSEVWSTNLKDSLTSFNPGIGDSCLAYGSGRYGAYFAVHGDSGRVQGHEGDQLTYVDDSGKIVSGGWQWGCSHSMAELISYHPGLAKFLPVCSSDCCAQTQWRLFDKERPRRVKRLLYVFRVLLTGIHLMRSGQVEANLARLNEVFHLVYLPDLITRNLCGPEKSTLPEDETAFYQSEYERLIYIALI